MKHFLYEHIRLDKNEPFYIGVGTVPKKNVNSKTESALYKRAYDNQKRRGKIWRDIVSKTNYKINILERSDNYAYLLVKETELVLSYGRINLGTGILANLTNGGEGSLGKVCEKETRLKISLGNKGRVKSIKEKEDIGKRLSKEVRHKITKEVFPSIIEAANRDKITVGSLYQKLRYGSDTCSYEYVNPKYNPIKKNKFKRGECGRRVKCIKTGQEFNTIREACNKLDISYWGETDRLKTNSKNRKLDYV